MIDTLLTLYGYQAWANNDLLDKLERLDPETQSAELLTARKLISHYHVVAEIFAAHLVGEKHQHKADNTTDIPTLPALRATLPAMDRWYRDYLLRTAPETLSDAVSFTFTDGDRGCMTRQEMLLHVVLHSAIHRGEVCRILSQLSITPPWDTLAVYLHQAEPARRQMGRWPIISAI